MAAQLSGVVQIAAERERQIKKEGFGMNHDDGHQHGELAVAACRYALQHTGKLKTIAAMSRVWPWASEDWKPKDPVRNLVRAGALIAAEIDRLQRKTDTKRG